MALSRGMLLAATELDFNNGRMTIINIAGRSGCLKLKEGRFFGPRSVSGFGGAPIAKGVIMDHWALDRNDRGDGAVDLSRRQ